MKKSITFLLGLLLLSGVATKSYGQAAGDYVFTQATDTLWATVGNWSVSDGAGGYTGVATALPGATNNVWIPSGKRMAVVMAGTSGATAITSGSTTATITSTTITAGMAVKGNGIARGTYVVSNNGTTITLSTAATATGTPTLNFYPACKNLYVNGFIKVTSSLVAFGDITVNSTGILTQASDLYCANINNYGVFNATTGYQSGKNLYIGFNGAIPGTGDYILTNDGIFGDVQPRPTQVNGSGIRMWYSNQSNSLTIQTSSSGVTGYAFNISAIVPHANIKTSANTTLNIKENISLLYSGGISLSVQNNDTSINTVRTCNIDPGVTVYVGGKVHANAGVTNSDQGSFVYNVYGTLDLASYTPGTSAAAANSLDLCMSSVSGNAGSLTFNLGDGTQTKPGKLILGSNMKLIKQSTQTLSLNFKDYSTVEFRGSVNSVPTTFPMNYVLLNNNNPALYLFPKKYYNLTLNGAGVVLPVVAGIKGTKTYTTVNTTANWIAATSAAQGSILYTGSAYYYVPVVRGTSTYLTQNPITLVADTVLQYLRAGQTVTGNNIPAATTVSAISGNSITLSAAPTATATQTNVFVTFTGKSDIATAPTGTSTNPFSPVMDGTQGLIYLGDATFATTSTVLTAVNAPNAASSTLVYSDQKNSIAISNATAGDIANVYTISGVRVASARLISDKATVSIASGIYLVKVNNSVSKVVVK